MKTRSILTIALLSGGLLCGGTALTQATVSAADSGRVKAQTVTAGPIIITDRGHHGAGYPDKPNGVPAELHRKVVRLYKRLHSAHPDASRKRIFLKIAEVLGIAPRRLWNAYHNPPGPDVGPPLVVVSRVDIACDARVRPVDTRPSDQRPTDRANDRPTDRARDRRVRRDRVTDRPRVRVTRDRPVRTRPQRGG